MLWLVLAVGHLVCISTRSRDQVLCFECCNVSHIVQSITRCTKAFKSTRQIQQIGSDRHYSERYFSEMEGIVAFLCYLQQFQTHLFGQVNKVDWLFNIWDFFFFCWVPSGFCLALFPIQAILFWLNFFVEVFYFFWSPTAEDFHKPDLFLNWQSLNI